MGAILILAIATLFAPRGGFGKAMLLFNAIIILLCFVLAARWSALPPDYNEWGISHKPAGLPMFVGFALLASSLVLAWKCFQRRPPPIPAAPHHEVAPSRRSPGISA